MSLAGAYPTAAICQLLELPRGSFYRRGPVAEGEHPLIEALLGLAAQWPTHGYRRLTVMLRRQGWRVNAKRVRRLMHALHLAAEAPKRRPKTTDSEHGFTRFANLVEGLEVNRPEQVWVADITYVRLDREFIYLAVLMDVFTRAIRGWNLGRSLEGALTVTALKRALARGCPEIHHSDQGVQYAATAYVDLLAERDVAISMAAVGKPEENGFAERLMRTIKEEEVDLTEYEDLADARRQLGRFLEDVYNTKRIHSSLGYLTPAEFHQQWIDMKRSNASSLT
jgi:transposase InsO family protein